MPSEPAVTRVDDAGIVVTGTEDVVVDVLFDDRRIWSFWVLRDSEPADDGARFVAWPRRLAKFLDGSTRLTVRAHVTEQVLFDEEVRLGDGDGRIAVVNEDGQPLGMDKSGRLQLTFETRSASHVEPLLDAIEDVLGALRRAGVEAFPAYGTLLGAVREGHLIGHDSDADLGYISRRTVPVDVIRESYALQRRLAGMGYRIRRYSGAGFAVLISEADGSTRGLDVFGGFFSDGHLIVLGEIRVPFEEEWVFPLGTTTLEGRVLPAPADPDRFLTATYGPSWRTPDPAFVFQTPPSTYKRLDDWFRGTVENRAEWDARYQSKLRTTVDPTPSTLAELVLEREPSPGVVVDVGCGFGRDAYWLAEQGLTTEGLDFSSRAFENLARLADQNRLPTRFAVMNLLETRHVLGHGARLARSPAPHVILARHIADAVPPRARQNLWRFASMLGRAGGRLYLEFLTGADEDDAWVRRQRLTPLRADHVAAALEAAGGTVVQRDDVAVGPRTRKGSDDGRRRGCRMVVEWQR